MARKAGQTRANGDRTKAKILDAAESLFGARGFDAVSLRDITDCAEVTLALASYHFGTKENLFEEVVKRRAEILCGDRRAALAGLATDADTKAVLDAFMSPLFKRMQSDEEGWIDYIRVLARLGEDNRWLGLLAAHFDSVAREFIDALEQRTPTGRDRVAQAFTMVLQLMLVQASRHRRLDALTDGRLTAEALGNNYPALLDFVTGGFLTLVR